MGPFQVCAIDLSDNVVCWGASDLGPGLGAPGVKGKQLAPRYVLWGEGTTDEMCLGLLQVADRS